ncbi:FKBP-type peptidyl-prolyl cis-trans isomerase [Hymenobacter sublimis]|uniref:Peptidyl-prolyl cis-trans isomerase n=1 Tax=Hymenobacter sublimis TaxID=2933777 RepID=A0ABY4J9S5_9BACT|nr:FKBP-type peptidyl-prolyl cis-trans isomerase [Hymenobacter sublimis]UPL49565.1 FKBP-type peptidyl-prolyl cis-trans isomerase [Hymenobacter sublimis]
MYTAFFRTHLPRLPLLLSLFALLLTACQKEEEDTTDYAARDETSIQAYIADNKLTGFQRQPSGLYVAITQPGTGATAKADQTVSAKYKGTTLDGNVFDSNMSTLGSFSFVLGKGQVIAGWDQGFALLNKGSKAILLIPSDLAYAGRAMGTIPAHSILRFDVEVTDIK